MEKIMETKELYEKIVKNPDAEFLASQS